MGYNEPLATSVVSISISENPDIASVGMVDSHLRDATAELSRHLLALGARVAYGGDLRGDGFTRILFDLVARHRRDSDEGDVAAGVLNYLAWPVHIRKASEDLVREAEEIRGMADLILLDINGEIMDLRERQKARPHEPTRNEWSLGLTAMRRRMVSETNARIVAGGRVEGHMGALPGVAEEALLSISSNQPLYVLGGFGGCAADMAAAMSLTGGRLSTSRDWHGLDRFRRKGFEDLSNGLTRTENERLARTQHIDEATALVLRGLLRLS